MRDRMAPESCRLKNHYPTEGMAEDARLRLQDEHGWLLKVYACRSCDEFHLTRVRVGGNPVPIVGSHHADA